MSDSARRTAAHWDAEKPWQVGRGRYWLELPAVQRRLNEKVSGRPEVDWVQYTLERYLTDRLPLARCLSLGCGTGALERRLAAAGAFVDCDAMDISPGSIARAAQHAQATGCDIRYTVENLNQVQLPRGYYDAAWSAGAMHHFEQLEHVFAQVAVALKPGGLFILHEYVGPNRFQFGPRQREILQACFELLPVPFRQLPLASGGPETPWGRRVGWFVRRAWDKLRDGDLLPTIMRKLRQARSRRAGSRPVKTSLDLPTARSVEAVDPSEAVRSAEIVPLLQRDFHVIELKPLGGSILQFLLAGIAGNLDNEAGERLLQLFFAIEDTLMETGQLQSDFAYIVARPREGGTSS